ncbi:MAG: AmmeMemoRadiSam system protein B [Thermoplasmatota archaeon]
MREPAVAGMFYPGTEKELLKELRGCFRKGPRRDQPGSGDRLVGLVSPHAGYTYSGPTAAHGFIAVADRGMPQTAVVIGPNHHGMGAPIGVSMEDFKTPLGVMRSDKELAEAIGLGSDERSHSSEHSMEVQLPFVQFFDRNVRQVCISMLDQSKNTSMDLGKRIAGAIRSTGRDAVIIASSDFTHCGWNYGYPVPAGQTAGDFARSRDLPVIEKLLEFDITGAFRKKSELGTTACGMGPIAAMYAAATELGAARAALFDYRTSYDVMPASSAVGYASIGLF